jgi:hypothetical protein
VSRSNRPLGSRENEEVDAPSSTASDQEASEGNEPGPSAPYVMPGSGRAVDVEEYDPTRGDILVEEA